MGKKARKKKVRRTAPQTPTVFKEDAVGESKTLKRVACVECDKDKVLVRMSDCNKCQLHKNDRCGYTEEKYRVRVVSINEPMKYNRLTFAMSSSHIQDDARNYYFLTSIMQPTKDIGDCPEYAKLRGQLLRGELSKPDRKDILFVTQIDGILYLEEATIGDHTCFYNGGKAYKEVGEFPTGDGKWEVLFHLYEMFSFDGLADIKIDDRFFKIKGQEIEGFPADLRIAKSGNQIVIGG